MSPEPVLLAVDENGRAPGPRQTTFVLDPPDQVEQILCFLWHLPVPPLQELEVLHLLARFRLWTAARL